MVSQLNRDVKEAKSLSRLVWIRYLIQGKSLFGMSIPPPWSTKLVSVSTIMAELPSKPGTASIVAIQLLFAYSNMCSNVVFTDEAIVLVQPCCWELSIDNAEQWLQRQSTTIKRRHVIGMWRVNT